MSGRGGREAMVDRAGIEPILELFGSEIKAVNLGLDSFAENLRTSGVEVVQVRWKPPAGGDKRMIAVLDRISRACLGRLPDYAFICQRRQISDHSFLTPIAARTPGSAGLTRSSLLPRSTRRR